MIIRFISLVALNQKFHKYSFGRTPTTTCCSKYFPFPFFIPNRVPLSEDNFLWFYILHQQGLTMSILALENIFIHLHSDFHTPTSEFLDILLSHPQFWLGTTFCSLLKAHPHFAASFSVNRWGHRSKTTHGIKKRFCKCGTTELLIDISWKSS